MTVKWIVTVGGAIFVCYGTLVVFFDGERYECGIIDGVSTRSIDMNREKVRAQAREKLRRFRAKQRALGDCV